MRRAFSGICLLRLPLVGLALMGGPLANRGALQAQQTTGSPRMTISGDVQASLVTVDDYPQTSMVTAGSTLSLFGSKGTLHTRAFISRFGSGVMSGYGDIQGAYLVKNWSAISVAVDGEAGIGTYRGQTSGRYLLSGVRVALGERILGQLHASRAFDTEPYSAVSGALSIPLRRQYVDVMPTVRVTHTHDRFFGEAQIGLSYNKGRIQVATQFGISTDPSRVQVAGLPWGYLSGGFSILRSLALNLSVGRLAPDFQRGLPPSRHVSIGLHVSPGSAKRSVSSLKNQPGRMQYRRTDSTTSLLMRLDEAQSVEIRGSFTEWAPVPMHRETNGMWSYRVTLPPGVHGVAIRINKGTWREPPGLVTAQDDFGGTYGLLVVE